MTTCPQAYKGMRDCFMRVLREEGVGAFYQSLPPRLMAVVPMIAIQVRDRERERERERIYVCMQYVMVYVCITYAYIHFIKVYIGLVYIMVCVSVTCAYVRCIV